MRRLINKDAVYLENAWRRNKLNTSGISKGLRGMTCEVLRAVIK
jgi:hypothetical protein